MVELGREKTELEKKADAAMDRLQKLADEQFLMSYTRDELLALKDRMRINYDAFYWASQMAEQNEKVEEEQCFATSLEKEIKIPRNCSDEDEKTEADKCFMMREIPSTIEKTDDRKNN